MTQEGTVSLEDRLRRALQDDSASARLQTAMAAGVRPRSGYIEILVERGAVEPDFFVRDALSWALIHQDRSLTLDRVLPELRSPIPQARSQALHTLAKLGDSRAWPAITRELLQDPEDEVARTAWRAAAALVPPEKAAELAEIFSTQFQRGDRVMQRSLSRALAALGDSAAPVVQRAKLHRDAGVRTHALATERLIRNPDEGFDVAIAAAQRIGGAQRRPARRGRRAVTSCSTAALDPVRARPSCRRRP